MWYRYGLLNAHAHIDLNCCHVNTFDQHCPLGLVLSEKGVVGIQMNLSVYLLLYYPKWWNSSLNSKSIQQTLCLNWRSYIFLMLTSPLGFGLLSASCWLHMMLSFWIVSPMNYMYPLNWHVESKRGRFMHGHLHCCFHSQSVRNQHLIYKDLPPSRW